MYDKQFFWCCFKNIFFSYSSGNGWYTKISKFNISMEETNIRKSINE
jgi:hypothetical protein